MSEQLAIKIQGLKKQYRLGQIGGGTLTGDLQSWWARVRHKEDPNSKIGTDQRLIGQTFMALNGIDLEVKKGEALGIIGGNGAGKSTMLKILSRITAPTEGVVDIYGRIASMLEVGTGFSGEMTGRENVYMNGAILGMTKAEIDAKMEDIIEFSEVREFIDTPVKRYSSGMYVKLAFSVAAHLDSEIMIMDEVLAVGDMAFQKKCLAKMRDAATVEGKTVLYVSHNMNTIRQLCDRCVVLDKGRIIFDGDVETAIGVYMRSDEEMKTVYDYSDYRRSPAETRKLQMLGCEIENRDSAHVTVGDELEFVMHCCANEDTGGLGLRLEIFYQDDTIAGTVFADRTFLGRKGEQFDLHIALPTKNYAPGKYRAVALFYERDSQGNQIGVDRVDPAFKFELFYSDAENLVWMHQYWGHVRFDDMVVKCVRRK